MESIILSQERVDEETITVNCRMSMTRKEYSDWIDKMNGLGAVNLDFRQ